MHGRSFTAPLTREALRAERRAAAERAVQGLLKVVLCSFLDQLPPRLPPRPSTNRTFTSFLTQTPIMLTKVLLHFPMRPHFLHNDANYGVNFLNTTTYVSLLSVDCAWFVSRLYHTFISRTNPTTRGGLAHARSESALQFSIVNFHDLPTVIVTTSTLFESSRRHNARKVLTTDSPLQRFSATNSPQCLKGSHDRL